MKRRRQARSTKAHESDAEWTAREQRKPQRRLHSAKLRYPAALEAVDFAHPRPVLCRARA